jgi:hypothetical protein
MKRKAQTNMIMVVLLMVIFAIVVVFLLSVAQQVEQEDYMSLYANNIVLSIMKTDTGYSDSNCKLMSDLTACAFILPDWICGDSGLTCKEMADQRLNLYMESLEGISQNYRYLFVVTTSDFISRNALDQGVNQQLLIGDEELLDSHETKRTSVYAIQKSLGGSSYNIKVTLYLAPRR